MVKMDRDSHPGKLCRLCARPQVDEQLNFLFSGNNDVMDDLADIININLPVKVSQIDPLPKQICVQCTEKVQATHEFALSCLAAEQELHDLLVAQRFRLHSFPFQPESEAQEVKDLLQDAANSSLVTQASKSCKLNSQEIYPVNFERHEINDIFQCPLCCEGGMQSCVKEPVEFHIQNPTPPSLTFEEELMALHRRANEDNSSDTSVVEEDSDLDFKAANDYEGNVSSDNKEAEDIDDEDYEPNSSRKPKRARARKKQQVRRVRQALKVSRGSTPAQGVTEESDSLIWIKSDNEQSIPLVQCLHCSGWLPGYASCLQHSLNCHFNLNESDEKTYNCARCQELSFVSTSDLISHFKKNHCPSHDLMVTEENGQFAVTEKNHSKSLHDVENSRDISYFCCMCKKGFSWLLTLLRHTCSQVNCSDMYCNSCNVEYRNRQRYVFHMNFHSEKAPPLECDVCTQSFSDDCHLYDHVRFAHETDNVVCNECGKHFRSDKGLAAHQLSAHNNDPTLQNRHKCTVCGKSYRDKQGLKEHLVTHMSEKPFPCDKCDRAYNRYSRLKRHQLSHIYAETMECYECVDCGLAFPNVEKALSHSTLEEHQVQNTVLSKVFRCEYCDTLFSCPDGLNNHRTSHGGEKPYVCHICGASFHTYSRVTTHKTTHGIYDQIEPQQGDFNIPRHFLCEHCGISYPYWSYLQTHRKMRHSENPYSLSCKLCPEKFKNSWSVIYHRRKVHEQDGSGKELRKRSLQCPHCGVNCMYQHTLSMHIERKHGKSKDDDLRESYQCEECGKVFKYQSSLLLHQKMHQGQKNFQCDECDKDFLTIATLRNHTKRCHQNIKPHQCEFCGKAFFHRVTRDDHQRVHTGEKPFKCQYCDKRFRLKAMLADHLKIHNDQRPYPCDVCGSSFRRMVHMKQHRMLHTGEKPFQCRYCGQDFRLKQELQRHMKTKHGDGVVDSIEEDEFIFAD